MLMPLPATLERLISEYEGFLAEETSASSGSQRLHDVAYSLCVSTGTREISDALDTARAYLAKAAAASPAPPRCDRRVVTYSPPPPSTATSSGAAGRPRGLVPLPSADACSAEG
ncbi:DUF5133 domain-containing protein [Streptomyces sp. NPDC001642]|uniref:DUF5133 domain-containing protein n=1 Tax=Streptomyces sp. NPDC001642 TaxID=3154392 RepID=UPI0033185003